MVRDLFVDLHHEPDEVVNRLKGLGCIISQLDLGDYAFCGASGVTVVERKEIGNLVSSLTSGELEEQLARYIGEYDKVVVLVEGMYGVGAEGQLESYRTYGTHLTTYHDWPDRKYRSIIAMLDALFDYGIETVYTKGHEETAEAVVALYDRAQKPPEAHKFLRRYIRRKPSVYVVGEPGVKKLLDLWDGLPEVAARKLVEKYGSVWAILQLGKEELMETDGVGPGRVKKLDEVLGR